MRDLASVELHFTKHSSVIAEKTSRTGGLRCTVSLYIYKSARCILPKMAYGDETVATVSGSH